MNESFVFKNKNGATCGYIMARGRQLRIRLPEGMEKACLTAVYEDGERNFEGGFDGYETERPNDGGRLIGAYVTADGKMVLDTGTAARKAFENRKATACPSGKTEGRAEFGFFERETGKTDSKAGNGGAQMAASALYARRGISKRHVGGHKEGGALNVARRTALL